MVSDECWTRSMLRRKIYKDHIKLYLHYMCSDTLATWKCRNSRLLKTSKFWPLSSDMKTQWLKWSKWKHFHISKNLYFGIVKLLQISEIFNLSFLKHPIAKFVRQNKITYSLKCQIKVDFEHLNDHGHTEFDRPSECLWSTPIWLIEKNA